MAFLSLEFPSRDLATQNLARQDACMQVGSCGGIFLLSQNVHKFVRSINDEDLFEGTRFDSLLSLSPHGAWKS